MARLMRAEFGDLADAVAARLRTFAADRVMERLCDRDPQLWGGDAARQASVSNRLGWLRVGEDMPDRLDEVARFIAAVREAGFRQVLLLGMGGSSLWPEVLARTFGVAPGYLELKVLDSTSPAAVEAAAQWTSGAPTLLIVASKSGSTIEVVSFRKALSAGVAGSSFAAITDPETALAQLGADEGYRHVFLNPPDIGGRYSALSLFGLVPAALLGVDASRLLTDATQFLSQECGPDGSVAQLGALLGEAARAGRDKLDLWFSPEVAAFGAWIEQLVAESTGKQGLGILPVDGETWAGVDSISDDRVTVITLFAESSTAEELRARGRELEQSGRPVLWIELHDLYELGGEVLRWEMATALSAQVLDINPFDEPNVSEAKERTGELLKQFAAEGALAVPEAGAQEGGLTVWGDPDLQSSGSVDSAIAAHLARIGEGDYFSVHAYLPMLEEVERELQALRNAVARATTRATTLGFGPRFLHSTGQLHKGGGESGVFLQVTAAGSGDREIPGAGYGFATLIAAQAAGDWAALQARSRRSLRVHVDGDLLAGLRQLRERVEQALTC